VGRRLPVLWLAGLGLSPVWCVEAAWSQADPLLTNPGLQQQQELQQRRQQQQPGVLQKEAPPLITAPGDGSPSEGAKADPELLINRVQVQGAHVISAERISAVFAPLISTAEKPRPVRFSQLQQALATASNLYREAGFFTSRVVAPRGALVDGVLTVVAVEGYLEDAEIIGRGSDSLKRWARDYLQPVLSTAEQPRPLRFQQLERQLLLLQGVGGMRFKTTLIKGSSFASSKLVLDLNPDAVSGGIGIDNNVQPQLGDVQATAQLQLNVLNALPQPLQLNAFASNAFPYGGGLTSSFLSFTTPLGNRGLRVVGAGSFTSTTSTVTPLSVGGAPLGFNTSGQSWLGSLALRYPVLLSRTGSLSASLSGELQNATNNGYLDSVLAYTNPTRLRVLRLGIEGSLSTPFYASSANLQISQGLPIANAFDQVTNSQTNGALATGSVSYTSARLSLRHQQRIAASNTFVTVTGNGQVASTLLPAPEDFAYGGQYLGRAYRGIYLTGDQGASAGVELSHAFSKGNWLVTPFLFADYGVASNKGGLPTPPNYSAASYGVGIRGNWTNSTNWEAGWAIPAGAYPNAIQRGGPENSIVYFRAGVSF